MPGRMNSQTQWLGNRRVLLLLLCICSSVAPGCAQKPQTDSSFTSDDEAQRALLHIPWVVQHRWQELVLRGRTDYSIAVIDERLVMRAEARNSASGLMREVETDIEYCSELVWSWRVDTLQPAADIRVKSKEDVAASIFLLFGDPGMLILPDPVPTLRYVWTNERVAAGTIVDSPYLPGVVRSLVVRSGDQRLGKWLVERRNVLEDFVQAFGHLPEEDLFAVALFTDNDQTGEPVLAYYEWIELQCSSERQFPANR